MTAALILWSAIAVAKPPVLASFDAGAYTIDLPMGWTTVADASKGTVVAQQDANRKDAAQLLVLVIADSKTTSEQALDLIAANAVRDLKIVKRDALPNTAGKRLVADGVAGTIKVRLGAIAIGTDKGIVLAMLISKVGDFEALGGLDLVTATLASLKPATSAARPQSSPAKSTEIMEPTYDGYQNLIVPTPRRAITQADLSGEWKNSGRSLKGYVNTATGGYAGYSATVAEQQWTVDAKGGLVSKYNGVHASNTGGGTFQVNGDTTGMLLIASDRVITIVRKGSAKAFYLLRGWFVGPELTVMRVNGPYYDAKDIDEGVRQDRTAGNLDELWVRKTRSRVE
jgi:hypothetical protein